VAKDSQLEKALCGVVARLGVHGVLERLLRRRGWRRRPRLRARNRVAEPGNVGVTLQRADPRRFIDSESWQDASGVTVPYDDQGARYRRRDIGRRMAGPQ
jgi:hypothetical protein